MKSSPQDTRPLAADHLAADPLEGASDLDDATLRNYATVAMAGWLAFAGLHALSGRPWTALVHVVAGLASGGARFVAQGPRNRPWAIFVLASASLAGLAGAAVLSGDPHGPPVTLLALVPLLSGVIRDPTRRRAVLALSLFATVAAPLAASHATVVERMQLGTIESVAISGGLGILVYMFGSQWRLRSDTQVARMTAQRAELEAQRAQLEASKVEIERARDEAVRASAAKSQFVSMTSHELRGPLNGLVGLSHALADTELSPHQRGIVQSLRGSSDALTKVVGDLLDLARVEAGRIELAASTVDVRELVEDVADTFSASTTEADIEVAAVVDPSVPEGASIDGPRLRQILANLVGNAVKFTERGYVRIEARATGGTLRIAVTDTGRGISQEDTERIFRPFEQVSDRLLDRRAGTGLGLWLARSFVQAMGGALSIRSVVGSGTTFEVQLPCEAAPILDVDRPSGLPSSTACVLVSSHVAGEAFSAAARRLGVAATVVEPGGELPRGMFDCVIVDIDDPTQQARIGVVSQLASRRAGVYLAASPRRLARAEEIARQAELRGVLLKPFRSMRLAGLLAEPVGPSKRLRPSAQFLVGDLLVVDDEPINRAVARHLGSALGLVVSEAPSGAAALDWLATHRCDVVLLDLHMEGMDGAETARRIHATHGPTPIVIGYSGLVLDEERARFHAAGVVEILGKPLERTTFETALRASVARARRRRRRGSAQLGSVDEPLAAEVASTPNAGAAVTASAVDRGRLDELVKLVGAEEAQSLARAFLAQLDLRVGTVVAATTPPERKSAAHKLGSSAATFGATELAVACRALERDALGASPTELAALTARVEAARAGAHEGLARALADWPASAPTPN